MHADRCGWSLSVTLWWDWTQVTCQLSVLWHFWCKLAIQTLKCTLEMLTGHHLFKSHGIFPGDVKPPSRILTVLCIHRWTLDTTWGLIYLCLHGASNTGGQLCAMPGGRSVQPRESVLFTLCPSHILTQPWQSATPDSTQLASKGVYDVGVPI